MTLKQMMANEFMACKEQQDAFYFNQWKLSRFSKQFGIDPPTRKDLKRYGSLPQWGDKIPSGIVWHIYKRMYVKNENMLMSIIGAPGTGKSWSAISLCCLIDPEFDEDSVCFSADDFTQAIKDRRRAIILDDVGLIAGSRRFLSADNVFLGQIAQAMRFLNSMVILTAPIHNFYDLQLRKLINLLLMTKYINRQTKMVGMRAWFLTSNPFKGKDYQHRPIQRTPKGLYTTINTLGIDKPTAKVIKIYESKKRKSFNDFVGMQEDEKAKRDAKNKPNEHKGKKENPKALKKYLIVGRMNKSGIGMDEIVRITGIPRQTVRDLTDYYKEHIEAEGLSNGERQPKSNKKGNNK